MELWNYAKCSDSTQTMQTRRRPCILQLTRQSHSLEMFAGVLEFLGYNLPSSPGAHHCHVVRI